jgi:hypothetical protein
MASGAPPGTLVFAVGGMKPDNLRHTGWPVRRDSAPVNLYQPGMAAVVVREAAAAYAAAVRALPTLGIRRPRWHREGT